MAINFQNALGTYETALRLRSQRAEILSSNLANADTPNYKARDFDFHAAMQSAMRTTEGKAGLLTTQDRHIEAGNSSLGVDLQYRTPTQPSIDGNTVDEHIEHAAFMENSLEFQTAFTLLNSRFKGLLSAIRGE
ncbi:flagellar basal body rod protein FlgB [Saccharophagus sp. K07]|uniref:flagellar basal body rod protein FlgB n=1 Tax=Saccharophagus sp. K07 TaxID=2283636 RepID=UPI00165288D5|nr:flagellar basal body rod protein FlgB [Saccharophagus sp. K07]